MLRIILALIIGCSALIASAQQVYKHVDKDGNISFTDQPPPDAQKIEIEAPNSAAAPSRSAYPAAPQAKPRAASTSYQVSISSPADETIIPRGPGNFSVSASVTPALSEGNLLQLYVDGSQVQAPQAGSSWALTNVFRGERSITVGVVDKKGKQLAISAPVRVYVFRPSSNFRK